MTRETEWDDLEREKMLGLAEYEAGLCECGFHKSLAHDPEQYFDLVSETCPTCAGIAARERAQSKADETEAEALKGEPGRRRKADGRRWFVKWVSKAEHERRVAEHQAATTSAR